MMDIAVILDLHGLRPGIKKLLIAGDIAPFGYPEAQQANVKQNFGYLLRGKTDIEVEKTLHEFPEVTIPTGQA